MILIFIQAYYRNKLVIFTAVKCTSTVYLSKCFIKTNETSATDTEKRIWINLYYTLLQAALGNLLICLKHRMFFFFIFSYQEPKKETERGFFNSENKEVISCS